MKTIFLIATMLLSIATTPVNQNETVNLQNQPETLQQILNKKCTQNDATLISTNPDFAIGECQTKNGHIYTVQK